MIEFFKFLVRFFGGWRRTLGLLTIPVALLCTVGWAHELIMPPDPAFHADVRKMRTATRNMRTQKLPFEVCIHIHDLVSESELANRTIDFRVFGLGLVVIDDAVEGVPIVVVPVWCIAMAFIWLSAWLLLTAPRMPRKRRIPEPPLIVRDPHGVSILASLLLRNGSPEENAGIGKWKR